MEKPEEKIMKLRGGKPHNVSLENKMHTKVVQRSGQEFIWQESDPGSNRSQKICKIVNKISNRLEIEVTSLGKR